ncbi:MAG: threonine/serine exporter family protein [Bacteroidales bacterium]|nr:threonine/serine exporter family protein [Bacteroidales bacterium]
MNSMTCRDADISVRDACIFLSEYAALLLGCGATCIRIEKNVRRMAKALGMRPVLVIMPACVQLTLWDMLHENSWVSSEPIHRKGIRFDINTKLSTLSWELADGKVSFDEARRRFADISHAKPACKWLILILASLANASFCRLFGGDAVSMSIVLLATLAGFRLRQMMLEDGIDIRLVFVVSAFVASVIGSAGYVFGIGSMPDIALGTSVLFLIPGVPYLNSMSDLLDGHYISFFSRFMDAAILTACISAGLCGGLLAMNLRWF